MACSYLFVYGTLRKGMANPMSRFLASQAKWMARGRTPGRLYDLGSYPGLGEAGSSEDWVWGDVYRVHHEKETLRVLDQYEGCDQRASDLPEFQRCLLPVTVETGRRFKAWAYRYIGDVSGRERIAGGDYLGSVTK